MTSPFDQSTLALELPTSHGADDFLPHAGVEQALGLLNQMQQWPQRSAYLHGPVASGKQHLARLWADQLVNTTTLDTVNVDQRLALVNLTAPVAPDTAQALFHLLNRVAASRGYLLITSTYLPTQLGIALADTASRLKALPLAHITMPDDTARAALLLKHFTDRQLDLDADVLQYLLSRLPRDYQGLADAAARLDKAGLRQQHKITIPLARDVLF